MERLRRQLQKIGAKAKVPTRSTEGVETDKARRSQEDWPQVIEVKQEVEDMALEGEETCVSSDKHEMLEPMELSVEPENSGGKPHELPIKAQELKERPAMERDIGKSFMERRFTQEKEKLERGLHARLKSVTEEKENLHQQIWILGHYHEKVEELTKKLGASERQLKNRVEAGRILEQDLQREQNKSTELATIVKTLTQDNIRLKSQNQQDSNMIDGLEERRLKVEYDLREKTNQLQRQSQSRGWTASQIEQDLRAEIEIKSQKTKELTVKVEKQEKEVRDVQQLAISMKRKLQPTLLADGEIREELEDEVASMKGWATKWAVSELSRNTTEYESNALQKELQKVVLVGTPPKKSTKDLLTQVKPRIAVHALLAQFFAERIFLQGFFTLDEVAKTSLAAPYSASMTRLLDLFLHSWSPASWPSAPANTSNQKTPPKRTLGAPIPSSSSLQPPRPPVPTMKPSPATSSPALARSFSNICRLSPRKRNLPP